MLRRRDWRPSLHKRVRLALAVLRGRQWWGDGYPTPWAYEQVCATLRREKATNHQTWRLS